MDELKPCPVCGKTDGLQIHQYIVLDRREPSAVAVECGHCGIGGPYEITYEQAIREWNSMAERTCHLVRHGSLADMPSFICWSCSECGFGLHHSEYDAQFLYCPHCGAKVVSDEEQLHVFADSIRRLEKVEK